MFYTAIGVYLFCWSFGFMPKTFFGEWTLLNGISWANIVSHLLFLHGFNPYWIHSLVPYGWSVAVEVIFYALLPFLFSKIKNIRQAFNFLVISIIFRAFLNIILSKFNPADSDYLFHYLPSQLPVFSLGIIMYFIVIENKSLSEVSGKSLLIFSLCILGQLAIGKSVFLPNHILF